MCAPPSPSPGLALCHSHVESPSKVCVGKRRTRNEEKMYNVLASVAEEPPEPDSDQCGLFVQVGPAGPGTGTGKEGRGGASLYR